MKHCYQQNKLPQEWNISHIVSVSKKGNKSDPGCYRSLSISSSVGRLLGKILQATLSKNIELTVSDQSGFTSGRLCTDNLFALQQISKKKISAGQELHMALIDLEKAYDSVPRC